MTLGVDVSHYQRTGLPWPAWVAAGLGCAVVQVTHGTAPEPHAAEHLAGAVAAGVAHIGAYHFLLPGNGEKQARTFDICTCSSPYHRDERLQFFALDVEEPGIVAQDVLDFCGYFSDSPTLKPLYLYGNNALAAIVAAHPELRRYGVWYADYGPYKPGTKELPLRTFDNPPPPTTYPAGLNVIARQIAGDNGRFTPYDHPIDLTVWNAIPSGENPINTPMITTGCLVGFHTQGNSDAVPIAADYAAAGARIAIMLADEDGGKAIDTQATVKTRITRLQFAETGDDHDFEGGGSGRLGWSEEKVNRYLAGIEHMLTVRLGIGELNAATHLQLGCNEWDAQDVGEWLRTLDILARVVDKVSEVSAALRAKGLTRPLRLALPAFNAGTPKTWAMYEAIAAHPIWPKLAAQGGAILFHEGIAFGQPFDWGENQRVEPEAPRVAGAGLVNFRAFNLLEELWLNDVEIDWAVGEWYDGRKRADDIEARVDNLIRHDRLLAGSKWARRCLGYATYELTNDPQSPWWEQNFTAIWKHPRWKAYVISVKDRVNGVDEMPNVSDADFAALLAANNQQTSILAKYKPTPVWKVGDVAVAVANPLQLFDVTHIPNGAPRPNVSYDINISGVSADGLWLQVSPVLWARAADVKHK